LPQRLQTQLGWMLTDPLGRTLQLGTEGLVSLVDYGRQFGLGHVFAFCNFRTMKQ
jgi:hypothetical protein